MSYRSIVLVEKRMDLLPGRSWAEAYRAGSWMRQEFIPNAAAEERIRRWARAGCPAADRTQLLVIGDLDQIPVIRHAFERFPDPIADWIVKHVVVFVLARRVRGVCTFLPGDLLATSTQARRAVIVQDLQDGEGIAATFAHECGHAWTDGQDRPSETISTRSLIDGQRPIPPEFDAMLSPENRETYRKKKRLTLRASEETAARFAAALGFTGEAADAEGCATSALYYFDERTTSCDSK